MFHPRARLQWPQMRSHIRLTRFVVPAIVFAILFATAFIDGYFRDEL